MPGSPPIGSLEAPSVLSLQVTTVSLGGAEIAKATGFLWLIESQYFLVTNWHVLAGRNAVTGQLNDLGAVPVAIEVSFAGARFGDVIKIRWPLCGDPESGCEAHWFEHPTFGRRVDVGALPVELGESAPMGARPLVEGTGEYDLDELYPGTELFAVGYPLGLRPGGFTAVWVRGTVASEPNIDFDDRPCFLIDARTREGQSGSPVIEFEPHGVVKAAGGLAFGDGPLVRVHGVYSGRTDRQSDLGYVWKRSSVLAVILGRRPPSDHVLSGLELK